MATVAILGGGISGLSCAYYLKTLGQSKIKYLFLLEKNPKFGGWIQTTRFQDGAVFEHGPRTLRVGTKAGYNALALADELNLSSRILPVTKDHPSAKTNLILSNKELYPVPRTLSAFFKASPPLKKPLLKYIFKELTTKKSTLDDESVYSFGERRIDKDVADYILDPMCRGIAAGDARVLSIRSMFPILFEAEQLHGSVIKGILKNRKNSPSSEYMYSNLVRKSYNEIWRMWTLKSGLTELIDTLACAVDDRGFADLLFNAECTQLKFKQGKVDLHVEDQIINVDHVFSCVPSDQLSKLVFEYPSLSDQLKSIPSVTLAVVYLEYEKDVLKKNGFGFLAPSFEDSKVLGIVFDSCCFPELNGINNTRLTCMIGGKWFESILGSPDTVSESKIFNIAVEEVKRHMDIKEAPVRHKVTVQRNCIPQYVIGHYKKLEAMENEIKKNNLCLSLLGASYKGAGVPDCIYNSKIAVQDYINSL